MKTLATLVFAVALTVPNASLWAISVPSENSGFEIRTTISVAKQKAYRNQLDATFRGFEARLSTMGRSGVLATLDALDTKLASLQGRKRVRSPSERFILAYLRHLVASKRNAVALSSDSTFPILPTPNAPGVGTSAPVDNTTDAVIAATVMSNPDAPKGRALTPLKEEEVAHIAVTARWDRMTMTDLYLSNAGTANLSERIRSIAIYDLRGERIANGAFIYNGTVHFSTSYEIPKNVTAWLIVKAVFFDAENDSSLGKTVALQLGALSGTTVVDGTANGVRLVSPFTGTTVPATLAGSSVSATHLLVRTKTAVDVSNAPTLFTNSFTVNAIGNNYLRLTRTFVRLTLPQGLSVTDWTLYQDREFGTPLATGTGPVPDGGSANPTPIYFTKPLDIYAGNSATLVLAIRTTGSAPIGSKRIFRVMDLEYQDVPPSGTTVTITGLGRYPEFGLPSAERTYEY